MCAVLPLGAALAGCLSTPDLSTPDIVVFDQGLQTDSIVVQQVVSPGPGWIAVYTDKDNEAASVVGHAAVKPGLNRWVDVDIDRPWQATARAASFLYVALHVDADAAGKWQFPGPDVPVTVGGAAVTNWLRLTYPRRLLLIDPM